VNAQLRHGSYTPHDNSEYLLICDASDAGAKKSADKGRLLIIQPLFDEMNRTRHTLAQAMRSMAGRDIASAVPDLPGLNESEAPLEAQSLSIWKNAITAAAAEYGATHILSIRGGCLIDDIGLPVMRLAPVKGASLLKKMIRTRIAGDKEAGTATSEEGLTSRARLQNVELAGNIISPILWNELEKAEPADSEMAQEVKSADISGSALWLRAEPQYDADMAAGLAKAVYNWIGPA